MNVYAVEDHTISCNISHILFQLNGVTWTPAGTGTDGYFVKEGVFDAETMSQVSTLTISIVKLAELREVAGSHTFTCKATAAVGPTNWTVEAIQTITIFDPSKQTVLNQLLKHLVRLAVELISWDSSLSLCEKAQHTNI